MKTFISTNSNKFLYVNKHQCLHHMSSLSLILSLYTYWKMLSSLWGITDVALSQTWVEDWQVRSHPLVSLSLSLLSGYTSFKLHLQRYSSVLFHMQRLSICVSRRAW